VDRRSLIFCVAAVVGSVAASAVGYSLAALPREVVAAARAPAPAERLGKIDLGPGFGTITVLDLLGYYLENPPVQSAAGGAPEKARRFGGC
jgi:hypothetical protein